MDKQQKLEYQQKIESYLTREHVYDLFEELLKQLVVKQPADPLAFLIDRLSAAESTPLPTQTSASSSLDRLASRSGSSHCRWPTTTSSPPSQWGICSRRR